MANNVLVYCEQKGGEFKSIAFECLTAGRKIASASGGHCVALVAAPPGGADPGTLTGHGAESVLSVENDGLSEYAPELLSAALEAAVQEADAGVVFMGATPTGKDLAPRLAARLGVTVAADCTDASWADGKLTVKRPIYAGKAFLTIRITSTPAVATIRPKAFTPEAAGEGSGAEVKSLSLPVADDAKKYRVKGVEQVEGARVELTEADMIVSGGRGMKDPGNFSLIEDLADALGAAVGASRAVVDAGWRPHSEQVGQTGKVVSPLLYIACGISGAIQHLAGMRTSRVIVAVNKDPEAPIFKVADYGIVGDALEVLPVLTEKVKALKAAD
jgi:electron transfer flavoprotein alpha subunit